MAGALACAALPAAANNVTVTAAPFAPISPPGEKPFTRIAGEKIGVYRPLEFSFKDLWPPFWNGRGAASGDFDNDGDEDIALASTDRGVHLFENKGGRFEEVALDKGPFARFPAMIAVLVDIDGDGWLDLFLSGYKAGLYVIPNREGRFEFAAAHQVLNRPDAVLAQALSFGDVDRDGDLDLAVGNWAAGWYRRFAGEEARNRIIFSVDGDMTGALARELDGFPGETLTMLLSDIDLDGDLDLMEGNDFTPPDIFYFGDGKGGFRWIHSDEGIIPRSTYTTMSMKTADLNNDLVPEIYISQIAGRAEGISKRLKFRPIHLYCSDIENPEDRARCQANIDTRDWYKFGGRQVPVTEALNCAKGDAKFEAECKAMMIKDVAIQSRKPEICDYIAPDFLRTKIQCQMHFKPYREPTQEEYAANIPSEKGSNVLLGRRADGTYEDLSKASGLGIGGWSWDVKIEDFDLDEYQDVYITNGHWIINRALPSNLHYKNMGDGTFQEVSGEYGLEEYLILPSVTATDIDNDGDRDLIGQAVNGPVMAFINNVQNPNRIAFQIRDHQGNRYGIGSRIVIHYGDGRHQVRELQLGGGFLSFDSAKAMFGLGAESDVDRIEVFWSTGEHDEIAGPFPVGALYTIARGAAG